MRRQDIINIISTFLMGFCVGVYLFFTGFAGFMSNLSVPSFERAQSAPEFEIVADAYGGCERATACPSFRVTDSGEYRYLYTDRTTRERVTRSGRLPIGLRRELETVLTPAVLSTQSREITPAMCDSFMDGVDIRYAITLEDNTYELDSCGTNVDATGDLWSTLSRVWEYLENR